LAGTRLVRSVADAVLHGAARRHVAELDQLAPARSQARVLLDLVRRARGTRFGREHDFDRIRSVGDFRRLVPLRRLADFWRTYWGPPAPGLDDRTWPGPVTHVASTPPGAAHPAHAGERNGTTPPHAGIPISEELLAAHRRAMWTALSWVRSVRPRARLLTGRILILEGRPLESLEAAPPCTLEEMAVRGLAPRKRPYVMTAAGADAGLLRQPVTCILGDSDGLLRLFAGLRQLSGRANVRDVWPGLAAVLYYDDGPGQGRKELAEAVAPGGDSAPVLLHALFRPEATLALEDPRHGLLRFLPAHDHYAEFIPVAEADRPGATRHGIEDVEPDVAYEVALSSPAGLWACRTGTVVTFEWREPPLLRVVEPAAAGEPPPPARADAAVPPFPTQPPHPRTAGSPAAPPGTSARTPWSERAGRE
jgi:hypothetical protein